jgi:uncharacterized protein YecE (DUF72 family)
MRAFIGTSGWQYADWKERLYPKELPQTRWLPYFSERFDTVEVNATFYRMPTTEVVDRWREAVPSDFTFAFKASRYLTHLRRLREPEDPVSLIVDRVSHLGASPWSSAIRAGTARTSTSSCGNATPRSCCPMHRVRPLRTS